VLNAKANFFLFLNASLQANIDCFYISVLAVGRLHPCSRFGWRVHWI